MKDFEEKTKELRVITLQDKVYLGIVKSGVIADAVECGKKFDKDDISCWFRCFNIGDVYEEIKLVGPAGYTIRPFDIEETRHAEQCLLLMGDAKKLAQRQIENDYFTKISKKNGNGKNGNRRKNGDEEDD